MRLFKRALALFLGGGTVLLGINYYPRLREAFIARNGACPCATCHALRAQN